MVEFTIVKMTSAYNNIIGCPSMYDLKVVSPYHQVLKFPVYDGEGITAATWRHQKDAIFTLLMGKNLSNSPRYAGCSLRTSNDLWSACESC